LLEARAEAQFTSGPDRKHGGSCAPLSASFAAGALSLLRRSDAAAQAQSGARDHRERRCLGRSGDSCWGFAGSQQIHWRGVALAQQASCAGFGLDRRGQSAAQQSLAQNIAAVDGKRRQVGLPGHNALAR